MLSKKTKYAIKALIVLGRNYGNEPMQIMRIAEEENIPKKFLEQILLEMRNAGILYSKKGAGGGYSLNKAPEDIRLSQVMRLIDGPIALLPCVSLNFYRSCDECKSEEICGIRDTFVDVRNAMLQILNDTSIADILNKEKRLNLEV
ncbi:Rrf2 family transcriptional regulator [Parapedobacter lycopersici]|uniref:RrF2 family transcriptional regulator n=1 Tax=Parapedobacter lycopersici TaxID=1864939 RepID=UPI00214D644E|nr:Rrf2 family transcriptional regulator [Parapedobacter lycopersici]